MQLTKADFQSDQETRWCPGCGDYAVLAAVQGFMPELGIPPERIVFVTGIGCAGRFSYYMDTYGMHGIHGRGPALATGLAAARNTAGRWSLSVSIVRATNVASAPSAKDTGLNGPSIDPNGVDLVTFPSSDVGDACPLVNP